MTGDLTMRGRISEFAAAARWLEQLAVPITIEPGNHDMPYVNLVERFVDPYRRYRRVEQAIRRDFVLDAAALISLRTTARAQLRRNWSWGIVRGRGLTATLREVREAPVGKAVIVACHHPLVDPRNLRSEGRTAGGMAALRALAEAGVTAVLSGHVHDPFDIVWEEESRSIRLIGAGTLSERLRSTRPSFNSLALSRSGIEVEVRTMPGA